MTTKTTTLREGDRVRRKDARQPSMLGTVVSVRHTTWNVPMVTVEWDSGHRGQHQASALTTEKTVVERFPCFWLIEGPRTEDGDRTEFECGAPARGYSDGSFDCDNGHAMGSMYEELGPYGNEWQREQEERGR